MLESSFADSTHSCQTWVDAVVQVIKCWRHHLGNRTATELLQQYSIPGLLLSGGVILGKLTQYGSLTDLHAQLEVRLLRCTMPKRRYSADL